MFPVNNSNYARSTPLSTANENFLKTGIQKQTTRIRARAGKTFQMKRKQAAQQSLSNSPPLTSKKISPESQMQHPKEMRVAKQQLPAINQEKFPQKTSSTSSAFNAKTVSKSKSQKNAETYAIASHRLGKNATVSSSPSLKDRKVNQKTESGKVTKTFAKNVKHARSEAITGSSKHKDTQQFLHANKKIISKKTLLKNPNKRKHCHPIKKGVVLFETQEDLDEHKHALAKMGLKGRVAKPGEIEEFWARYDQWAMKMNAKEAEKKEPTTEEHDTHYANVQTEGNTSRKEISRKDKREEVGATQKSTGKTKWEEIREAQKKDEEISSIKKRKEKKRMQKLLDESKRLLRKVTDWFSRKSEIQKEQQNKKRNH